MVTIIHLSQQLLSIVLVSLLLRVFGNHLSIFPFKMDQIILYYTVFSLTTAIFCWIFIFNSIRNRLEFNNKNHIFVQKPIVSGLTFILLVAIVSPLFIPVVLSDNIRETFIKGMYEGAK